MTSCAEWARSNVLTETDHPFDLAERDPVGFVRSAGLAPADEEEVLWRNVAALLSVAEVHAG